MPPRSLTTVLGLALLLAGCAQPTFAERCATLFPRVGALRGHAPKTPVRIRVASASAQVVHASGDGDAAEDPETYAAFGVRPFRPPADGASRLALGLYDFRTHEILLPPSPLSASDVEPTLVHELEHALQDQWFGTFGLTRDAATFDERLALLAVYEGDAGLVEYTWSLRESSLPETAGLRRIANDVGGPARFILEYRPDVVGPLAAALSDEPAMSLDTILFPHTAGFRFVESLYERGRFDAVDRAFRRPPTSTEQILHVEKYLASEEPIRVPQPAPPEGHRLRAAGTVGEFRTRTLLNACVAYEDAKAAAGGWGGDAYSIVEADGRFGLLWSLVWDDVESAERFEGVLSAHPGCGLTSRTARSGYLLRREGARTVIVRGFEDGVLDPLARTLLSQRP